MNPLKIHKRKRMIGIVGISSFYRAPFSKKLRRELWRKFPFPLDSAMFFKSIVEDTIEWNLNPCPYHGMNTACQVCEPMSQKTISSLNYQTKRYGRHRKGCAPLRKRRKRLHKKLAKRGFSASPTSIIWSSPRPGYGIENTEYERD